MDPAGGLISGLLELGDRGRVAGVRRRHPKVERLLVVPIVGGVQRRHRQVGPAPLGPGVGEVGEPAEVVAGLVVELGLEHLGLKHVEDHVVHVREVRVTTFALGLGVGHVGRGAAGRRIDPCRRGQHGRQDRAVHGQLSHGGGPWSRPEPHRGGHGEDARGEHDVEPAEVAQDGVRDPHGGQQEVEVEERSAHSCAPERPEQDTDDAEGGAPEVDGAARTEVVVEEVFVPRDQPHHGKHEDDQGGCHHGADGPTDGDPVEMLGSPAGRGLVQAEPQTRLVVPIQPARVEIHRQPSTVSAGDRTVGHGRRGYRFVLPPSIGGDLVRRDGTGMTCDFDREESG